MKSIFLKNWGLNVQTAGSESGESQCQSVRFSSDCLIKKKAQFYTRICYRYRLVHGAKRVSVSQQRLVN